MMVIRKLITLAAASLLVAGCVNSPTPRYQTSINTTQALLAKPGQQLAVGEFVAGENVENKSLGMRGNTMTGAGDGRFTTYLREALIQELEAVGRFQPTSKILVSGELLENELKASGASKGYGTIAVRIRVERDGSVAFEKSIRVEHDWKSSFIGAIAIPAAMNGYVATVNRFLGELFSDPDFINATR